MKRCMNGWQRAFQTAKQPDGGGREESDEGVAWEEKNAVSYGSRQTDVETTAKRRPNWKGVEGGMGNWDESHRHLIEILSVPSSDFLEKGGEFADEAIAAG